MLKYRYRCSIVVIELGSLKHRFRLPNGKKKKREGFVSYGLYSTTGDEKRVQLRVQLRVLYSNSVMF